MSNFRMRRLGRTGFQVTELGMGGYQYTGEFGVSQQEATKILDLAFEAGINFFDTAAMYGFGESEEMVARALVRHGKKGVFVSTKVGWLDRTVVRNLGNDAYLNEDALTRAIKHSLWILRLDHVDVMMIHEPDWGQWGLNLRTGDAPITTVLERLKKEGVIGAVGMGGWNCDVIADLIETNRFDVALIAGGINLLGQPIKDRVLPAAKKHDVGIILGGAMGQGSIIAKDRKAAQELIDNPRRTDEPLRGRKLLALYLNLSDKLGLNMPQMAMRLVAAFPEIHTHIAGAREAAHLTANIAAVEAGPLPADVVAKIEAIGRGEV